MLHSHYMSTSRFNHGMYADPTVADQWQAWTQAIRSDDIRNTTLYPRLSSWIAEHAPRTVLEIGAGQGISSSRVTLGDARYIGVEPSARLRELASEQYPHHIFLPGIAESLPIADDSINCAFSLFVWLHIDDIESAGRELARVLAPDGRFMIITANPNEYDTWKSWHQNLHIDGKRLRGDMPRLSHHEMYLNDYNELISSFTNAELSITSIDTYGIDPASPLSNQQGFAIIIEGYK
jgi:ubiquinone/menaquinone biosynthesis C-methylase UbiE